MIGVDYSDKLEQFEVEDGEVIFIVDFSFSASEMKYLSDTTELIWIDHHESAIRKCEGMEYIRGIREVGRAGCELTWDHLHSQSEAPLAVYLLGRYDVWDHEDPRVLPFQYGTRHYKSTLPEEKFWMVLLSFGAITDMNNNTILETGEVILEYQAKQDAMYARGMAYEAEFHGHQVIVMNKAYSNSKVFDSVYDPEKHDFMVLYGVKPGEIKYSLYCDKPEINVSKIAEQYGGGGHAGAAGFYSEKLIL
jgi:oligoribonuclease NrnB/cAMP/cGMP phosphodiesterase (DHH superfamily)